MAAVGRAEILRKELAYEEAAEKFREAKAAREESMGPCEVCGRPTKNASKSAEALYQKTKATASKARAAWREARSG